MKKANPHKNKVNAWKTFYPEGDGKAKQGYVLHHKDPSLRHNDPDRYNEWRPEDLVMITRSEHSKIHYSEKENFAGWNKGKSWSDDVKKKMSDAQKGIHGHNQSEKTREIIAQTSKERWANAEYAERVRTSCKESWSNPDLLAKQSALMHELKWFTNKITGKRTRAKELPGEEWVQGRLKKIINKNT